MFANILTRLIPLILICLSFQPAVLASDSEATAKKILCRTCLGKIYIAQGLLPEAAVEYTELLKLTPNDARLHFDLGNIFARSEKPEQAVIQYKAAAKLRPAVPEYQVGLGNAYMYTKNYEGAVQAYTRACTLGGKFQKQLQTAQQYQAQQKLLDQYKSKIQNPQEATGQ